MKRLFCSAVLVAGMLVSSLVSAAPVVCGGEAHPIIHSWAQLLQMSRNHPPPLWVDQFNADFVDLGDAKIITVGTQRFEFRRVGFLWVVYGQYTVSVDPSTGVAQIGDFQRDIIYNCVPVPVAQ